jgi:hypothetical protein
MVGDAPSSYDELFDQYYGYVRSLVRSYGIREDSDVASEIILRFFARGFLDVYDPTVTRVHDGVERRTSFKAFLKAFVERYSRHFREKEMARGSREPLLGLLGLERLDRDQVWVSAYMRVQVDEVGGWELVEAIRAHLLTIEPGRHDLPRFFEVLLQRVQDGAAITKKALAAELGCSTFVVGEMFRELQGELRPLLAEW